MLKNYIAAISAALLCSGVIATAQTPAATQEQQPPTQTQQPKSQPEPQQPEPQQPQTQQPQTQRPSETQSAAAGQQVTMTGCVYREEDVPGRAPNPAERAGILEDYILADVKPAEQQSTTASTATATPGAVGTSGVAPAAAGSMFKLELIDDDRLRTLVGKRVEVTGRVDSEAGDTAARAGAPAPTTETDRAIGRDRVDLPEFEVASIKEVEGTCPSKPAGR